MTHVTYKNKPISFWERLTRKVKCVNCGTLMNKIVWPAQGYKCPNYKHITWTEK